MRAVLLIALAGLAGCASDVCRDASGVCLALRIEGMNVTRVDQLAVSSDGPVRGGPTLTPATPVALDLPMALAVELPAGTRGTLSLTVRGMLEGSEVGRATDVVTLDRDGTFARTLRLIGGGGDLGVLPDAAGPVDLLPRPPGIACGANTCAAMAQLCCTKDNGASGTCQYIQQMTCGDSQFLCDGPEDCPPAEPECCATNGVAQCGAAGGCGGAVVCHVDANCPMGQHCCPSPPPGLYGICLNTCP